MTYFVGLLKRMCLIDIFGLMLNDLEIHIYYQIYLLVEICLSFLNLYHICIEYWLLYACLTIKVR